MTPETLTQGVPNARKLSAEKSNPVTDELHKCRERGVKIRRLPSSTFLMVLAISLLVRGFITNPLIPAALTDSSLAVWLKPVQRIIGKCQMRKSRRDIFYVMKPLTKREIARTIGRVVDG